jgi:hypothetical protein
MLEWISRTFDDWDWNLFWPEVLGKCVGVGLGILLSWYLVVRRRVQSMMRLQQGDSDDLLFQAHYLHPLENGGVQLLFRNVAEKRTIEQVYDNPAAVALIRQLGDLTTLNNPLLPTQQTIGFEILNDAASWISGSLATSPAERTVWLFCLTCEDRTVVRKRCVRAFLIRPADLKRFYDWNWCKLSVFVERPWHWFRIVALHRIARLWADQCLIFHDQNSSPDLMPLVDDQYTHRRITPLSLGLAATDCPIATHQSVPWTQHLESSRAAKLELQCGPWPTELQGGDY